MLGPVRPGVAPQWILTAPSAMCRIISTAVVNKCDLDMSLRSEDWMVDALGTVLVRSSTTGTMAHHVATRPEPHLSKQLLR